MENLYRQLKLSQTCEFEWSIEESLVVAIASPSVLDIRICWFDDVGYNDCCPGKCTSVFASSDVKTELLGLRVEGVIDDGVEVGVIADELL